MHHWNDMLGLMKIYTRRGDHGDTGLIGGARVRKSAPRVAAYGAVDELNAVLGVAVAELGGGPARALSRIQNTLFALGAELAAPPAADPGAGAPLVSPAETAWLESEIDAMSERLPPLRHFVLPGGTRPASTLHLARTVCRRAERAIVALSDEEAVRAEVLAYMNRLSDYLFVLARAVNAEAGAAEPKWLGRDLAG